MPRPALSRAGFLLGPFWFVDSGVVSPHGRGLPQQPRLLRLPEMLAPTFTWREKDAIPPHSPAKDMN